MEQHQRGGSALSAEQKILEHLNRGLDAVFGDDTAYRSYIHNRMTNPKVSPAEWAKAFTNGAALEERYQREWNAGARIADDCRCRGCRARGYSGFCPACQREANGAGR